MDIGSRIRLVRKKLSLTQATFAERIGLKQAAIGLYENGQRNVVDRVISDICREFNVSEEWLRNGKGNIFVQTPDDELSRLAEKYNFNDAEYNFFSQYVKLDISKRRALVEFLENFTSSSDEEAQTNNSSDENCACKYEDDEVRSIEDRVAEAEREYEIEILGIGPKGFDTSDKVLNLKTTDKKNA